MLLRSRINSTNKAFIFHYQSFRDFIKSTYERTFKRSFSNLHEVTKIEALSWKTILNHQNPFGLGKNIRKLMSGFPHDKTDWTRGRFTGSLVKVVVFNGVITEKLFITKRGSVICVKRDELGFF